VAGGFGELTLEIVGEAEVIVGVEAAWVDLDGLLEIFLGRGKLAQAQLAVAALKQEVGIVGELYEGLSVDLDCFLVLAAARFCMREREVVGCGRRPIGDFGFCSGHGVVVGLGVELPAEERCGFKGSLILSRDSEGNGEGEGGERQERSAEACGHEVSSYGLVGVGEDAGLLAGVDKLATVGVGMGPNSAATALRISVMDRWPSTKLRIS